MQQFIMSHLFKICFVLICTIVTGTSAKELNAGEDVSAINSKTQPKIVKIFGAGGFSNLKGYGTGFLISPQGHIVTIWSHVLDASSTSVILHDGRRFEAKIVGVEPAQDIGILKIEAVDLPYFDLKKAVSASPGNRILGFSNMFKVATGDEPVSLLHGVVAAKTKLIARRGNYDMPYDGEVYILDAITNNPGAAGGVVTNYQGELFGIIGKELRDKRSQAWINYAIPVIDIRDTVEEIITGKYKPKKSIDEAPVVLRNYDPIDFGMVMVPNIIPKTPPYLDSVLKASAASQAGLKPDDLIVFINDELVQSVTDVLNQLGKLESGDQVKVVIRRSNTLVTATFDVQLKSKK
jgi:serine protease Do